MQFDQDASIQSNSFGPLSTKTVAPALPQCVNFPDSIKLVKLDEGKYVLRFENTYKCDQSNLPPIESITLITDSGSECSFNAKNGNDYYLSTRGSCNNYAEGDHVTIKVSAYKIENGYTMFLRRHGLSSADDILSAPGDLMDIRVVDYTEPGVVWWISLVCVLVPFVGIYVGLIIYYCRVQLPLDRKYSGKMVTPE